MKKIIYLLVLLLTAGFLLNAGFYGCKKNTNDMKKEITEEPEQDPNAAENKDSTDDNTDETPVDE